MSLHSYTFTALQNAAKHALGKTPDSTTSLSEIVNDALQMFVNLHTWSWMETSTTLSFTASQAYIALPADFLTLKAMQVRSASGYRLDPSTLQKITDLRMDSTAVTVNGIYMYAISWAGQASVTASPTARLELWPTPPSTVADAISITYRRQIRKLTSSSDLPDIPAMCHFALKKFVRAYALEDDGQDGADKEMASAMLMVQQLVSLDTQIQPSIGFPRPGVHLPDRVISSIRPGDSISVGP